MRLSRSARTHTDIDHSCAAYVQRTSRLPTPRDTATDDHGDPRRVHLAAAIELGRRTHARRTGEAGPAERAAQDRGLPDGAVRKPYRSDRDAIPDSLGAPHLGAQAVAQ